MEQKPILVVDDEKNIRLTVSQSLKSLEVPTDTAENGEEALEKVEETDYGLILLDLRLPGMHGMEVLEKVSEIRPDIKVIIITAYGSVESAVKAMKQGAVDYIQKPFSPDEIRDLVSKVLGREELTEESAESYEDKLELAKKNIQNRHFDAAVEHAKAAIALDSSRPEAHNLLGTLLELQEEGDAAGQQYRKAISVDPTYQPARKNLDRISGWEPREEMHFGEDDEELDIDEG